MIYLELNNFVQSFLLTDSIVSPHLSGSADFIAKTKCSVVSIKTSEILVLSMRILSRQNTELDSICFKGKFTCLQAVFRTDETEYTLIAEYYEQELLKRFEFTPVLRKVESGIMMYKISQV